jgi:hypothetical protein
MAKPYRLNRQLTALQEVTKILCVISKSDKMRLLNTSTMKLVEFLGDEIPPYAILSHTWQVKEILFKDMINLNWNWKHMNAFRKIQGSCEQALRDGLEWVWLDTYDD